MAFLSQLCLLHTFRRMDCDGVQGPADAQVRMGPPGAGQARGAAPPCHSGAEEEFHLICFFPDLKWVLRGLLS